MNCTLYDDVLDEYVDGARAAHRTGAPDPRLTAFEAHLAGCTRCQTLVADFTKIRGAAGALDEYVPPARVWASIASSIDESSRPWWERSFAAAFSAWVPVAVAASLAIVIVGVTWFVWQSARQTAPTSIAQQTTSPDVASAEDHYEQAIAGLQQIADAQDTGLDPKTRAVLQQNLAVIDRAITESRAALAAEPASALAQESLLDALDTKVALLQDTVTLATEMNQSPDETGAAQEVNQ